MAHDFKKLDIERAQIAVSIQGARDLVSQWIGHDDDDSEDELPIPTMTSSTAGLGAASEKPAPTQNAALSKLQKKYTKPVDRNTPTTTRNSLSPSRNGPSAPVNSDSESDSESRTTVKTKKRGSVSAIEAYKQNKKKKSKR